MHLATESCVPNPVTVAKCGLRLGSAVRAEALGDLAAAKRLPRAECLGDLAAAKRLTAGAARRVHG